MAKVFSLIVPTYNERDNIGPLLDQVRATLGPRDDFEIIVVDDDSPDLTWSVVEDCASADGRITLVRRRGEKGLSSAVIAGFNASKGAVLGVMDADLSHDCRILPELISAVRDEGFDLAVGSRRVPGGGADRWPWYRKAFSSAATIAARRLLEIGLRDPMSGYFVLDRDLFERVKPVINPRGYKILLEIYALSHPARVKEIPFVFKDRRQGVSKLSVNVAFEYLRMLRELRGKRKRRNQAGDSV